MNDRFVYTRGGMSRSVFSRHLSWEKTRPKGLIHGSAWETPTSRGNGVSLSHMNSILDFLFIYFFVMFKLILVVIWLACHESTYEKNRFIFSRNMNWVFFVGFSCYVQFDWLETFLLFLLFFFCRHRNSSLLTIVAAVSGSPSTLDVHLKIHYSLLNETN